MNEDDAIGMLLRFFSDRELSFRKIDSLKKYWDKAVEALDEERSEQWANYHHGSSPMPDMPDKGIEEDFYATIGIEVANALSDKGVRVGDGALPHVVDMVVEMAEIEERDFYYTS